MNKLTFNQLTIGLIINPVAGIGGAAGFKGSDGIEIQQQAAEMGFQSFAQDKTKQALAALIPFKNQLKFVTCNCLMGEDVCKQLGFDYSVEYNYHVQSTADDTINAAIKISQAGVDLILFAGGDGTARNICQALINNAGEDENRVPVVGIPAGCKIHSGVYSVTPSAAGKLVADLVNGNMMTFVEADVMDIDESLFRQGQVKAKRYGELRIPHDLRYIQAVKQGGKEVDELVIADIAADIEANMEDDVLYLFGSGSTTQGILAELGLDGTLLGVDAVVNHELVQADLNAKQILELIQKYKECKLVITPIGGQGHLFGRGNQQLTTEVIAKIGKNNILVVATKNKINTLNHRPLIIDNLSIELGKQLSGLIKITTGYKDTVLYPITNFME
ncbi:ATP-NAD kinase family protein [Catenovulum sp. SX2]|uniref:ATP-NAD kinase family protein n=1 Tax=Catenovulum sp. SX2 TaxID=3398614 RepID=UPI003F85C0FB